MKTAEDFLARWKQTVGALLLEGWKAGEIEVCIGTETARTFGSDLACLNVLGPHLAVFTGGCQWGGVWVILSDAPRLLLARPKMAALRARQKARK